MAVNAVSTSQATSNCGDPSKATMIDTNKIKPSAATPLYSSDSGLAEWTNETATITSSATERA